MTSSTSHPLHSDSLPLIDLRHLTQSELHSLSVSSPLSLCQNENDVVPKIDRSVFNESAGSRKQTYSRLRLARKPEITPDNIHPKLRPPGTTNILNDLDHAENVKIVNLFKILFASSDTNNNNNNNNNNNVDELFVDELVPVYIEYGESVPDLLKSNNVVQNVSVDVASFVPGSDVLHNVSVDVAENVARIIKRKRGRPRKSENVVVDNEIINEIIVSYENEVNNEVVIKEDVDDKEILNKDGVVVDIVGLGNLEDPYGEELRRRTFGLEREEELLGFLSGLVGQWGSRRKKRKIVDASGFGNALPKGWKLLLSIKKKGGRAWLICRRYISPSGRLFISCNEVSSYLQSIFGLPNESHPQCGQNDESLKSSEKILSTKDGDKSGDDSKMDEIVYGSTTPLPLISAYHKKLVASKRKSSMEMKSGDIFNCHICNMTFFEGNELLHHLLFSHKTNGKRRKIGANVGDGVIVKDGKFECQFCHKVFDERHRYSGHVGNHVKNYVKNIEASSEPITMQRSVEPATLSGEPPIDSRVEMMIANNVDVTESSYNGGTNTCLSSDNPCNKLEIGSTLDTCTDELNNELAERLQNMDGDRNDKIGVEVSCDKLGAEYQMANAKVENARQRSDKTEVKCCLVAEAALFDNENNKICQNFDQTDVLKSINNELGSVRRSGTCSPAPNGEGEDGTDGKSNKVSASSIEELEHNVVVDSCPIIPHGEKKCLTENNADMFFTNRVQELDEPSFGSVPSGSCGSGQDLLIESNQLVASPGQQKGSALKNEDGVSSAAIVEPKESIRPSQLYDDQTCTLDNNMKMLSNNNLRVKFKKVGNTEDEIPEVGLGIRHSDCDKNSMRVEQERNSGSCAPIPFINQQIGSVSETINGGTSTANEYCGDRTSGNSLAVFSRSEQPYRRLKTGNNDSCTDMDLGTSEFENSRDNELMVSFGSIQNGLEEDVMTSFEQLKSSEGIAHVSPPNEQALGAENSSDICSNSMEENRHEQGYVCGLVNSSGNEQDNGGNVKMFLSRMEGTKLDEVRIPWNNDLMISLGNSHPRLDMNVNRNFGDHSLVFSGNEQTIGDQNNAAGTYNGSVEESKQGSAYGSSLLGPFGQELMFGLQNNLNRGVPTGSMWGGRGPQSIENSSNSDLMIGFGCNLAPHNQNVLAGNMWRTEEENVLQSGLTDASLPVVQSSGYFTNFGMISNKGDNELFGATERFDSLAGFEGLKSGNIQQREYNFLAAQADTLPEKSRISSYEAETEQQYNSSLWLENDSLFPKADARNQSTVICVWCRNQFYDDAFNSATQTGSNSIGQICPSCKANI